MKSLKFVLLVCVIFFASSINVLAEKNDISVISNTYHESINLYTKHFGEKISPDFVSAIVFVESRGKPRAVNKKTGAIGLMQVMPDALEQVREAFPDESFSDNLFNPDNNLKVGIAYLTYLRDEFDLESHDALAVGFSSGPKKGERFSQRPRRSEYACRVKKATQLFASL